MWNYQKIKKIEDLLQFNLVNHELKNKTLTFKNDLFLITNVFKEWNCGWYLSLELKCISSKKFDKDYLKIPFLIINTEDKLVQERIKIFNEQLKFL